MRPVMFVLLAAATLAAQQDQQPSKVDPGGPGKAPSDAEVLFDGTDLTKWRSGDGGPAGCQVEEGDMVCRTGSGNVFSGDEFGSAQMHVEFNVPFMPSEKDQGRGNSGFYIQGRYEIQILDSYDNPTYPTGQAGALYDDHAPLVNASRPPGEWQSYDIIFHAFQCDPQGNILRPGTLTVFHNGVLIHDNVPIRKVHGACIQRGPIMLQDHAFPGAPITVMRFRNIWVRPIDDGGASTIRGRTGIGRGGR
ncbi:MAG TPA: DUF1080 domain-containing protein [Bryobacteraceae bacterium]|nr:DUF1080 domain-containing protein [Bryobacteraceae bacterium]